MKRVGIALAAIGIALAAGCSSSQEPALSDGGLPEPTSSATPESDSGEMKPCTLEDVALTDPSPDDGTRSRGIKPPKPPCSAPAKRLRGELLPVITGYGDTMRCVIIGVTTITAAIELASVRGRTEIAVCDEELAQLPPGLERIVIPTANDIDLTTVSSGTEKEFAPGEAVILYVSKGAEAQPGRPYVDGAEEPSPPP